MRKHPRNIVGYDCGNLVGLVTSDITVSSLSMALLLFPLLLLPLLRFLILLLHVLLLILLHLLLPLLCRCHRCFCRCCPAPAPPPTIPLRPLLHLFVKVDKFLPQGGATNETQRGPRPRKDASFKTIRNVPGSPVSL